MHFLTKDDELLKKYNNVWNKVSDTIKKEFDSESNYNKKILKTEIKTYNYKATDFHNKEIPKVGSNYICLALILTDFFLKKDGNYYPQMILKTCKYIEKKVIRYINNDLEIFSDNYDKEISD